MGEVYRARDPRLNRDVAIKVVMHTPNRAQRDGLLREVRTAAALSHPHICAIYDVGEVDSTPFFVMELLDGVTLAERAKQQPFDANELLAIARQVADALAAAHERGIIHRDIKPSNVMVTSGLKAKIVDFGVARAETASTDETIHETIDATHDGTVVGTIQYMPPEVLRGHPADARSDIWSFGVMMYELAAGRAPFAGATPFEATSAIMNDEPAPLPPAVPAALRAVIARTLQKDPAQRFQRATDIEAALMPAEAPATVASSQWIPMTAIAVAVMVVGGLAVWRFVPREQPRRTSTGAPVSTMQEANEAFELAMNLQRTQNDMVRSREWLAKALAADPHFAEALRFHALGSALDVLNGLTNDRSALYTAEQELQAAQKEAPDLISLPSAFAAIYMMQGRAAEVPTADLDRAARLDPSHRDTAFWRAMLRWIDGDTAHAREQLQGLLEREPLWAPARTFLADTLRMDGNHEGALREIDKVLAQGPNNVLALRVLAKTRVATGDAAGALSAIDTRANDLGNNFLWRLTRAWVLAHAGQPEQARAQLDEATVKYAGAAFPITLDMAEIYAVLGEASPGIEWFERAVRNGDHRVEWFLRNPDLAAIRNDPRFQTIIGSLNQRR